MAMDDSTEYPFSIITPALKSAVLGATLYVSTLGLRLDNHGWHTLGLWNLLVLFMFLAAWRSIDVISAASQVLFNSTAALFGLFGSVIIYRLYFSPIRHFPGPWQAAITNFYRTHLAIRSKIRLFTEVKAMHEQYGDYVRTGPREVSILNPNAIPIIYGAKSQCKKGPWYDHDWMREEDKSVFLLTDPTIHSWRRRIMDRGFSSKALADYEPRVQIVADKLIKALKERAGTPIDLTSWIGFFSFDTMGRVAYSQDFGMLERGEGTVEVDGHSTSIQTLHETSKVFGVLGSVPWFIRMVIQTNLASNLAAFHQWCRDMMGHKQRTFDPSATKPADMSSHLVHAAHFPPDPQKHQTPTSLASDAVLLIIAGSDTTASALTNALFYLATHPPALARLRAALAAAAAPRTLASCAYLDAVLNETLRLKPPACQGLARETPPSGITVPPYRPGGRGDGSAFIPGGTVVSVPTWALHRDERFWGADADAFRPERWLEGNGGVDTKSESAPFIPFSRGARSCPGKMLAYVEMRAVVAGVVGAFDIEVLGGEEERRAFDEGCLDTFTMTCAPLRVVLRERVG